MRKTLFSLTLLATLAAAGAASAQPVWVQGPPPGYGYGHADEEWRAREWRHREWERHHHWEQVHQEWRGAEGW